MPLSLYLKLRAEKIMNQPAPKSNLPASDPNSAVALASQPNGVRPSPLAWIKFFDNSLLIIAATALALALTAFSLATGLAAAVAMLMDVPDPWLLVAFLGLCGLWYWLTFRRERAVAFFAAMEPGPAAQRRRAMQRAENLDVDGVA